MVVRYRGCRAREMEVVCKRVEDAMQKDVCSRKTSLTFDYRLTKWRKPTGTKIAGLSLTKARTGLWRGKTLADPLHTFVR